MPESTLEPDCNNDFEEIEFSDHGSMITIGESQWSEDALTESSSSAASSDDDEIDPLRRPIDVDIASGRMPKIIIEASSGPVRWFEVSENTHYRAIFLPDEVGVTAFKLCR